MRFVRQEVALKELPVRLHVHLFIYLFDHLMQSPSMQQLSDLQLHLPQSLCVGLRPGTCRSDGAKRKVLGFQVPTAKEIFAPLVLRRT